MKITFTKKATVAVLAGMLLSPVFPMLAMAATDTAAPVTSITSPLNGTTVSGIVSVTASATDAYSSCVVTLFGQLFDVTSLQSNHTGGNIFNCGTDMTSVYQGMHGTNLSRMAPYSIPASYSGVAKVELYVDGTLVATDLTSSTYSFIWNSSSTANGAHVLRTKGYDQAGNVGTSAAVNITVSNSTSAVDTTHATSTVVVPPLRHHDDADENEDEHESGEHGAIFSESNGRGHAFGHQKNRGFFETAPGRDRTLRVDNKFSSENRD